MAWLLPRGDAAIKDGSTRGSISPRRLASTTGSPDAGYADADR